MNFWEKMFKPKKAPQPKPATDEVEYETIRVKMPYGDNYKTVRQPIGAREKFQKEFRKGFNKN